jgi:hypothetical protein
VLRVALSGGPGRRLTEAFAVSLGLFGNPPRAGGFFTAFPPIAPIFLTVLALLRVAALATRVFLRFALFVPLVFFLVAICRLPIRAMPANLARHRFGLHGLPFKEAVYWQCAPPLTISFPDAQVRHNSLVRSIH